MMIYKVWQDPSRKGRGLLQAGHEMLCMARIPTPLQGTPTLGDLTVASTVPHGPGKCPKGTRDI
jgi:hypothetical protein